MVERVAGGGSGSLDRPGAKLAAGEVGQRSRPVRLAAVGVRLDAAGAGLLHGDGAGTECRRRNAADGAGVESVRLQLERRAGGAAERGGRAEGDVDAAGRRCRCAARRL